MSSSVFSKSSVTPEQNSVSILRSRSLELSQYAISHASVDHARAAVSMFPHLEKKFDPLLSSAYINCLLILGQNDYEGFESNVNSVAHFEQAVREAQIALGSSSGVDLVIIIPYIRGLILYAQCLLSCISSYSDQEQIRATAARAYGQALAMCLCGLESLEENVSEDSNCQINFLENYLKVCRPGERPVLSVIDRELYIYSLSDLARISTKGLIGLKSQFADVLLEFTRIIKHVSQSYRASGGDVPSIESLHLDSIIGPVTLWPLYFHFLRSASVHAPSACLTESALTQSEATLAFLNGATLPRTSLSFHSSSSSRSTTSRTTTPITSAPASPALLALCASAGVVEGEFQLEKGPSSSSPLSDSTQDTDSSDCMTERFSYNGTALPPSPTLSESLSVVDASSSSTSQPPLRTRTDVGHNSTQGKTSRTSKLVGITQGRGRSDSLDLLAEVTNLSVPLPLPLPPVSSTLQSVHWGSSSSISPIKKSVTPDICARLLSALRSESPASRRPAAQSLPARRGAPRLAHNMHSLVLSSLHSLMSAARSLGCDVDGALESGYIRLPPVLSAELEEYEKIRGLRTDSGVTNFVGSENSSPFHNSDHNSTIPKVAPPVSPYGLSTISGRPPTPLLRPVHSPTKSMSAVSPMSPSINSNSTAAVNSTATAGGGAGTVVPLSPLALISPGGCKKRGRSQSLNSFTLGDSVLTITSQKSGNPGAQSVASPTPATDPLDEGSKRRKVHWSDSVCKLERTKSFRLFDNVRQLLHSNVLSSVMLHEKSHFHTHSLHPIISKNNLVFLPSLDSNAPFKSLASALNNPNQRSSRSSLSPNFGVRRSSLYRTSADLGDISVVKEILLVQQTFFLMWTEYLVLSQMLQK